MGSARALGILKTAYERSLDIQMNRLSKVFGFELQDGLPKALLEMDRGELKKLLDGFCANWLANDGVWFQAVEFKDGMNDAKRCNDSVWAPIFAHRGLVHQAFSRSARAARADRAEKSPRVPDLRPDQHPVRHRGGPRQPGVPDERVPGAVRPQTQRPCGLPLQVGGPGGVRLLCAQHRRPDSDRVHRLPAGPAPRGVVLRLALHAETGLKDASSEICLL